MKKSSANETHLKYTASGLDLNTVPFDMRKAHEMLWILHTQIFFGSSLVSNIKLGLSFTNLDFPIQRCGCSDFESTYASSTDMYSQITFLFFHYFPSTTTLVQSFIPDDSLKMSSRW